MKDIFEFFILNFNIWKLSPFIFAATLLTALVVAGARNRASVLITPNKILFIGTYISIFTLVLPTYLATMELVPSLLMSAQHSFRVFALDGDFIERANVFQHFPEGIKNYHIFYGSVLHFFAPLLTFGFILSFFKNLKAYMKFFLHFWTTAHVFSELNAKTLAMAENLYKEYKPFLGIIPRISIVFTDVIDKQEEKFLENHEAAKRLGAILFRRDLASIHFRFKYSIRKVNFYLISEDEQEKILHIKTIIDKFDYNNVVLRVFSNDPRVGLMIDSIKTKNINVIKINDAQSLIYRNLYYYGANLYKRARKDGDKKVISAVIVGLGNYGTEMLKALVWYCQYDGYQIKINAYDLDEKAEEKLKVSCPGLMEDNKKYNEDDANYDITIHSGMDVTTYEFKESLSQINDATYIFVSLGEDNINLGVSMKIREICETIDYIDGNAKPVIETIVYDSGVSKTLSAEWSDIIAGSEKAKGAINHKEKPYNILMTGDLYSFYSYEEIIDEKLVQAGWDVHRQYSESNKKLLFAYDRMEQEWKDFLSKNKLTKYWNDFLSKNKLTKSGNGFTDGKESFKLGEIIQKYTSQKLEGDCKEQGITLEQASDWANSAYKNFNDLINEKKNPENAEAWNKEKANIIKEAIKDFSGDYNRRSSIAKAIYKQLVTESDFAVDAMKRNWEDLTFDQKLKRGRMEHIRWNAYMKTEGYKFGERNDLGKLHQNIVPTSKLTNYELMKDS